MARIRTIKPEFFDSPSTARASYEARLFFIALWCWADDYGVGTANAKQLIGFAFPNDPVGDAEFPRLRTEVAECFGVQWYEVDGRSYYAIPSWEDHQKNERRANRKNPTPDQGILIDTETHGSSVRTIGDSVAGTGEQGNRGTGEQNSSAPSVRVSESDFNRAYSHWPKKVERKEALDRFKAAAKKRGLEPLIADVVRFGDAYARTTERQFVPALGVWLKGERWDDDLPGSPPRTQPSAASQPRRAVYGNPPREAFPNLTDAEYQAVHGGRS